MDFPDIANVIMEKWLKCLTCSVSTFMVIRIQFFWILWRLMDFPSKGGKTVTKGFALSLVHLRLDVSRT